MRTRTVISQAHRWKSARQLWSSWQRARAAWSCARAWRPLLGISLPLSFHKPARSCDSMGKTGPGPSSLSLSGSRAFPEAKTTGCLSIRWSRLLTHLPKDSVKASDSKVRWCAAETSAQKCPWGPKGLRYRVVVATR